MPKRHIAALLLLGFIISTATSWLHAEETMSLTLRSEAFDHGEGIPSTYTCEAENLSPPLRWEGVPQEARSLVLIVDDPDAPDPDAPRMTWVHWVVYDLPPGAGELAAGGPLPSGARQGLNDWGRAAYGGPCPPIGRHRYLHKLYALDCTLGDLGPVGKAEIEQAMDGHVLDLATLIGTYQKQG